MFSRRLIVLMILALCTAGCEQPKPLQPLQQVEGVVLDPASVSPPLTHDANGVGQFAIEDASGNVQRFTNLGKDGIAVKTGQKVRVHFRGDDSMRVVNTIESLQ